MNLCNRSFARFYARPLLIAGFLFCVSISAVCGQERSTDRDNPTAVMAKVITDDLDGSDTAYFYKFTAGPGKLTVTIEVKASGTNAGAMLDLFDANSRPLLSDVLAQGIDGGSERIVNSVQLSGKRNIVMRIKGLKYGDTGGTGTYKIMLDGLVVVPQAAPAPAAEPAPAAAPAAGPAPVNPAPAPAGNNAPAAGNGGVAGPTASINVSGFLEPADERMIFHKINIDKPGQITFSFSVKATDAKVGAKFAALTDTNKQPLDGFDLQPGESKSKTVTFDKAQTLLIMIGVNKVPGNVDHGIYSLQISGPAGFGALVRPDESKLLSGQLEPESVGFHLANVNDRGQVSISFSVKGPNANAAAKFGISTTTGKIILPVLDVKGGESITKPFTFDKPTTITFFIQAVKPPDNGKDPVAYSIQLSGPVTAIR